MEKKKAPAEIRIDIQLTIEVPDSSKPKVTFNIKGPKKGQS